MCCELPDVRGRHVVLGVTGGIAVYKSCEIVSRLRKLGVETHVIMTKNAAQFVQPLTFETLSNHPVVTDTFARPETWEVEHIALAKRADVFAIAPATANIMAKMACGIAGTHIGVDILAMILFGSSIGVLLCFLGGLMAVDIAPRNASGAALGVVGIASYIGAGLQDVMSGILIEGQKTVQNGVDVYDFTYINWFWIGAALLSVLFALLVWNAKSKEVD